MANPTRQQVETLLRPRFIESGFCGFWPPDGWLNLIIEIHEQLSTNPDYRIVQIKEKFGGLRFYTTGLTDGERDFLRNKEAESHTVCQQCGSHEQVELRRRGWLATLCTTCWAQPEPTRGYRLP